MRLWAFQIDSDITLEVRLLPCLLAWFACIPFYTSYEPFHGLQKGLKKRGFGGGEKDTTKTETSLSLCKQYAMLFASDTPHRR
jgi:hypothetical protein